MLYKTIAASLLFSFALPFGLANAAEGTVASNTISNFTLTLWGVLAVLTFIVAYYYVMREEVTHLKKSVPAMISAGVIWLLVALAYQTQGDTETPGAAFGHAILEYGELFLFLLAAMTYVNTIQERNVFELIRYKLLSSGLSQRMIFWATGLAAFFLSPILDNLTTSLVMCSVAVAVGGRNKQFVALCAINIVIAANAGGAYSPFGDITTLMVWQSGHVEFFEFFSIFLPSLANWLVPAFFMSMAVRASDIVVTNEPAELKEGAWPIVGLFGVTIVMAVLAHQLFHLPSALGMMTGLGLLKLYGHFLSRKEHHSYQEPMIPSELDSQVTTVLRENFKPRHKPFNTFVSVKRVEWDTLLFFYGIIMSVAGLGQLGYLAVLSELAYGNLGPTWTNIGVGLLSAVVDNIPVMYAVLQMSPEMSHGQWMLVTLTAGVGGSLLSVGSAAGVALMGFAKVTNEKGVKEDAYTFNTHLKWTPVIFLGYVASIIVHILVHSDVTWPWL
jgi:Na+/H+ antiporter NhaD/arsenite permease-like protein